MILQKSKSMDISSFEKRAFLFGRRPLHLTCGTKKHWQVYNILKTSSGILFCFWRANIWSITFKNFAIFSDHEWEKVGCNLNSLVFAYNTVYVSDLAGQKWSCLVCRGILGLRFVEEGQSLLIFTKNLYFSKTSRSAKTVTSALTIPTCPLIILWSGIEVQIGIERNEFCWTSLSLSLLRYVSW